MSEVLRFALLGAASGALYALSALAIVIVQRGSGVVNFANGAFGLTGALVYYELRIVHGQGFWIALVGGLAASSAVGVSTHYLVMRPLRTSPAIARVIATLGVLIVLSSVAELRYGTDTKLVPSSLPRGIVRFSGIVVPEDRLILLGMACSLTGLLWAVYRFTRLGRRTTAVTENAMAAAALGVSPDRVAALNWGIGGALSGLVGIFLVPIVGLSTASLSLLLIPSLAAALVGRMTSFPLTLLGGVFIGVVQSEMGRYALNVQGAVDAVPFAVIIVILIFSGSRYAPRGHRHERLPAVGTGRVRPGVVAVLCAMVLAIVWGGLSPIWIDTLTLTLGIGLVMLSTVVITGYTGQLSLAQLSMAGMGAWFAGRTAATFHVPFLVAILVGVAATIPVGIIIGLPAIRARGVSLAIATLGFAVALEAMIFNNADLTGGGQGTTVGTPTLFGWKVDTVLHPQRYFTLVLVGFVIAGLAVANVRRGAIGRRLLAIRSNERAAASLGISVVGGKLYAFAVSSAIAALGGVLLSFRDPTITYFQFDALGSVGLVANGTVGGIGWVAGPLVGAQLQPGTVGSQALDSWLSGIDKWLPLIGGVSLLLVLITAPDGLVKSNVDQFRAVVGRLRKPRPAQVSPVAVASSTSAPVVADKTLSTSGLTVSFGGVHALLDVSIEVRPGEIVGLIGPNGAGKSTFIEAVTGYVRPAAGTVSLDGRDLAHLSPERRARLGIARSFQSLELFEDLSVLDNLCAVPGQRHGLGAVAEIVRPRKAELTPMASAAVDEFNLRDDLDKMPTTLSYGRRRLVAIARAVAIGPSVLMLDEPAAGLDPPERVELGRLLSQLAAEWGMGILLVEHDVDMVLQTCARVYVLEFGRLLAQGPADEIRNDPEVIRAYLGTPTAVATEG